MTDDAERRPIKVIVISDSHLSPQGEPVNRNFRRCVDYINREMPDLVINAGDITLNGVESTDQLAHARELHDAIGCEVRFVPGNHDLGDNPHYRGHLPSVPVTDASRRRYCGHFADTRDCEWWSTDFDDWRLTGINVQLFGTGLRAESAQWEFLSDSVNTPKSVALFVHKPLFANTPIDALDAPQRFIAETARERVYELLARQNVRLMISGHVHQQHRTRHRHTDMLWTPSTAFHIPNLSQPTIGIKQVGVLEIDLTDAYSARFTTPDGLVNHDSISLSERG